MQVLYLAKKYMLPSLADKCTEFLQENVGASNVFHVLPDAMKYEDKDLLDHCWEVIDDQTDEAVKSDEFERRQCHASAVFGQEIHGSFPR
jgi:hypothetical protein